jgi:ATP-dependent Clp protease protease subunit
MNILSLFLLATSFFTAQSRELVKLTEDNFVVLRGSIDGQSSSKLISELHEKKTKDLYVYLLTGGGSVTSGMQIIQTLKALEQTGVNINCITNVGLSMGFVITQYCQNRLVMDSSILMQHQASFGVKGPVNNVNSYVDFIHSMINEVDEFQANRMNMTIHDFKEKTRDDWWLIGSEAVKHNAADKLVYVMCEFKNKFFKQQIETIFGTVQITYSTCPVARDPYKIEFLNYVSNEDKEKILDDLIMSRYIYRIINGKSYDESNMKDFMI